MQNVMQNRMQDGCTTLCKTTAPILDFMARRGCRAGGISLARPTSSGRPHQHISRQSGSGEETRRPKLVHCSVRLVGIRPGATPTHETAAAQRQAPQRCIEIDNQIAQLRSAAVKEEQLPGLVATNVEVKRLMTERGSMVPSLNACLLPIASTQRARGLRRAPSSHRCGGGRTA